MDFNRSLEVIEKREDQRIVLGVALVPDVEDAQGDIINAEEIAQGAHDFMANYGAQRTHMGIMHKATTNKVVILESYIAPVDLYVNGKTIVEGSWVVKIKVNDGQIWKKVKNGQFQAFSIGGTGKRIPMEA
jgi:hypothetical protein